MTKDDIEQLFTYHPPKGDQPERYVALRDQAKALALLILDLTPSSPEQTIAIRKLSEAIMFANQSIAVNE